jgi:hypothetical protein
MNNAGYRHTQRGTWLLAILAAAVFVIVIISSFKGWQWNSSVAIGIFVIASMLFPTLTVEIEGDRLKCWFGIGLIRKEFDLAEIVEAKAVRNRWHYGLGIRYTPHGWLFNISGLDAVELALKSGKHFRIGTDEPERLVAAIRQSAGLNI